MLSDLKLCRFCFVKNFATAPHIVTRTTSQGEVGTSYHFLRSNVFSSKPFKKYLPRIFLVVFKID